MLIIEEIDHSEALRSDDLLKIMRKDVYKRNICKGAFIAAALFIGVSVETFADLLNPKIGVKF